MIRSGKDKGSTTAAGAQSWRELAGPNRSKINSPQAKKRRRLKLFKLLFTVVVLAGVIAGSYLGVRYLQQAKDTLTIKTPSQPVQRLLFNTDGVLPDKWVGGVINLRPGTSMMEVDIYALKQLLEAEGQVKSASVERVFPGDLKITLQEHTPVLRLAMEDKNGQRRVRIVARDGTVYEGTGYPKSMLQRLPYVLPYRHADGSYFPLRGVDRVADLLDYARNNSPELLAKWQVVSLRHYSGELDLPGQVIEVRSGPVPRIIFSASADYGKQLDRLKYILSYIRNRDNQSIERVDLSLHGSAAVQFTSGRIGSY